MFVSMWMTKDVRTVTPETPLNEIATLMAQHRIRRAPVVASTAEPTKLIGMISKGDVLHAFPANVNPLSYAATQTAALGKLTAADVMTRDPITTTPESPIEQVAKIMCDRKIGALPVVRQDALVGLITESDLFRAFAEIAESGIKGVRITFDNSRGEDVFPLVAEVTQRHKLRVLSFVELLKHERPVCVLQVAGEDTQGMLDDIWKSHHQIISVIHLEGEPLKFASVAKPVFYKG